MKIYIIDKEKLDEFGAQSKINIDKEFPDKSDLIITKKAFEGDEFFTITKTLLDENYDVAETLINHWIIKNALHAIAKYLPESESDEIETLIRVYQAGMISIVDKLKYHVGQLDKIGLDGFESIMHGITLDIIRSQYPELSNRAQKHTGLKMLIRKSIYDELRLYIYTDCFPVHGQYRIREAN